VSSVDSRAVARFEVTDPQRCRPNLDLGVVAGNGRRLNPQFGVRRRAQYVAPFIQEQSYRYAVMLAAKSEGH